MQGGHRPPSFARGGECPPYVTNLCMRRIYTKCPRVIRIGSAPETVSRNRRNTVSCAEPRKVIETTRCASVRKFCFNASGSLARVLRGEGWGEGFLVWIVRL